MYHVFFIHSSFYGHLGCFHVLVIVNSAARTIGSLVETRMDLETVVQSEVSQKEKNKYRILTHICGIYKNDKDNLICKAEIETQM